MGTAAAAGDFDFQNAQHHGTPQERRDAWVLGFRSGDPSVCGRYVPA
jgi:predicted metalloprotease